MSTNFSTITPFLSLYKISQILSTSAGQQQIIAEVLDALDVELGMKRGVVTVLSSDGETVLFDVTHQVTPMRGKESGFRLGEGITGKVIQSGKPIIVPKISAEPSFLDRANRMQHAQGERSFICVPIMADSKCIGAISVDLDFGAEPDLIKMQRLLSIVASMIAHDITMRRRVTEEKQRYEDENTRLRSELEDKYRPENIIGNSNAMRDVYRAIYQVAPSDATVLIRGESGTGKELVAHAIHYSSHRAKGPFVRVNCAALNENLLESELFGHEKGAFTGAIETHIGHIEEAEGGTLFLDEIGDFSPAIQVKLLRVLQEREYKRVGSNKTIKSNARIICATNRNLEEAVEKSQFRQDLYYRINVFPIFLPPLRDRKDDILLLVDNFVEKYAKRMNKDVKRISTPAINIMTSYHWPGNVRELENCIERAVLLSNEGVIHGHHLPPTLQTSDTTDTFGVGSFRERVSLFERDLIVDALKRTGGNLAGAARDLSTTSRIIRYKVQELGIDYRKYRRKA